MADWHCHSKSHPASLKAQIWVIVWNWLQKNESPERVRLPSTISSGCDVSPHYKPLVTKCHAVMIEAFVCTLMKTHVFQWDTCNQMNSMIRDKTMYLINRVAVPSLFTTISRSLSFSLSPSLSFHSLSNLFSHFASKNEPLLMSPTNLSDSRFSSLIHFSVGLSAAVCPLSFPLSISSCIHH